jgi:hypothetical protein
LVRAAYTEGRSLAASRLNESSPSQDDSYANVDVNVAPCMLCQGISSHSSQMNGREKLNKQDEAILRDSWSARTASKVLVPVADEEEVDESNYQIKEVHMPDDGIIGLW